MPEKLKFFSLSWHDKHLLCFQWFKNSVSGEDIIPDYLIEMFKYIEPIYNFHVGFLKEIEQRLAMWWVKVW